MLASSKWSLMIFKPSFNRCRGGGRITLKIQIIVKMNKEKTWKTYARLRWKLKNRIGGYLKRINIWIYRSRARTRISLYSWNRYWRRKGKIRNCVRKKRNYNRIYRSCRNRLWWKALILAGVAKHKIWKVGIWPKSIIWWPEVWNRLPNFDKRCFQETHSSTKRWSISVLCTKKVHKLQGKLFKYKILKTKTKSVCTKKSYGSIENSSTERKINIDWPKPNYRSNNSPDSKLSKFWKIAKATFWKRSRKNEIISDTKL